MNELQANLNKQKPSHIMTCDENYQKAYYIECKETRLTQMKVYREENNESIRAQQNTWHQCVCGRCYTMTNRKHHRSQKHVNFFTVYTNLCVLADRYLETGKTCRASLELYNNRKY
jgi:hypothetical protein